MPVPSASRASGSSMASSTNSSSSSSTDVLRIAVTNTVASQGGLPQNYLMQLSRKASLESVVEELCRHFNLPNPSDCALTFETTKEYVTERTRESIKNGTVLKLCPSPRKLVRDLMSILDADRDPQKRLNSYKALQSLSSDYAMAAELIRNADGLQMIVRTVCDPSSSGQTAGLLIGTFHEVMKHEDLVSWDDERISPSFVAAVAACVDTGGGGSTATAAGGGGGGSLRALALDERAQQCCLSVLEALVCTPSKCSSAESAISVHSLLHHFLQSDSAAVQQSALALFNAMFRLGDRARKMRMKQAMEERGARRVIVEGIIIGRGRQPPSEEMRRQLYVLQTLLLNLLEEKMLTPVEPNDQKALEKIMELRKIALDVRDVHHGAQRNRYADDYRKLGFRNEVDPRQDFRETPPGMLSLELMYLFAVNHTDQYTKLVLENSCRGDNHECPFARTSIEVVKLMCSIIRIGEQPLDQGTFLPMFFAHENPLEEMFAITIQHVNKTWREMRATTEDFPKVLDVAREQISGALRAAPMTMEEYRKALKTYNEISESRKEEAKSRGEREGKAIQHLSAMITPEIVELIQRHRFKCLVAGTRLNKYKREGGKERGKYYCRLSSNHKTFNYGDWVDEANVPSPELLPNKLPISEIKDFLVGSACPHFRESSNRRNRVDRSADQHAFSFVKENGDTVDFTTPCPKTFDIWCDGVNALLRKEMRSGKAAEDLKMFLEMEVKIRLLDVEGIKIPDEPPPVPPLPQNFNFCQEI